MAAHCHAPTCAVLAVWELLTGSRLYPGLSATRVAHMVAYEGARPHLPADCPPGYMRLMTSCWQANPQHRCVPDSDDSVRMLLSYWARALQRLPP